MDTDHLTNDHLMSTDFATSEKIPCLPAQTRHQPTESVLLPSGRRMHGVWMTDVSAMDRRSLKAQLAGRGDWRAAWWQLNCVLDRWFAPHATLEQRMFAFHVRHHALTLARLELVHDFRCVYAAIRRDGLAAGLRCAFRRGPAVTGEQ